jgi:hypothetical protein
MVHESLGEKNLPTDGCPLTFAISVFG